MDKKILNISISILMITLSLSLFQIVNRVNQYFTIQENVLLQQQELVLSAKDLSSDISLFGALYFEIYLYKTLEIKILHVLLLKIILFVFLLKHS